MHVLRNKDPSYPMVVSPLASNVEYAVLDEQFQIVRRVGMSHEQDFLVRRTLCGNYVNLHGKAVGAVYLPSSQSTGPGSIDGWLFIDRPICRLSDPILELSQGYLCDKEGHFSVAVADVRVLDVVYPRFHAVGCWASEQEWDPFYQLAHRRSGWSLRHLTNH